MFIVCPHCLTRRAVMIYQTTQDDMIIKKYRCLNCFKYSAIIEQTYTSITGEKITKKMKFKLRPLPIPVYDEKGNKVTYITKEDLDKWYYAYRALYRAFGVYIPFFYDDEHLFYINWYKAKYDGYYAALYADGIKVASKRLY
jgi:hypothetical protein